MQRAAIVVFPFFVLICTIYMFVHLSDLNLDMASVKLSAPLLLASLSAIALAKNSTAIDLNWHAPTKSWINDLEQVLNGTGTNGFVFGGSQLPSGVQYGTYNWCNMPHVRKEEYKKVSDDFELLYVEVYIYPHLN